MRKRVLLVIVMLVFAFILPMTAFATLGTISPPTGLSWVYGNDDTVGIKWDAAEPQEGYETDYRYRLYKSTDFVSSNAYTETALTDVTGYIVENGVGSYSFDAKTVYNMGDTKQASTFSEKSAELVVENAPAVLNKSTVYPGETLGVNAPIDGVTYQWYRVSSNNTVNAITGATGSSYTIPDDFADKYVYVTATVPSGELVVDPVAKKVYIGAKDSSNAEVQKDPAASIGSVKYPNIDAALDAVNTGETIKLLADTNSGNRSINGADITIDTNGKKLNGVLTLNNSSLELIGGGNVNELIANNSSVDVTNAKVAKITSKASGINVYGGTANNITSSDGGSVNVDGGAVQDINSTGSLVEVSGGAINNITVADANFFIYGGTVGTVTGTKEGTAYISGGTINKVTNQGSAVITGGSIASLTVSGGSIENNSDVTVKKYTLTISGQGGKRVEDLITAPTEHSYGMTDVKTDSSGKIYVWLPSGVNKATATVNGIGYSGAVKNNAGTLKLYSGIITSTSPATHDKTGTSGCTINFDPGTIGLSSIFNRILDDASNEVASSNYEISGNSIVLKKDYLDTLPIGKNTFTFDLDGDVDPSFVINVKDSSLSTKNYTIAMTEGNDSKWVVGETTDLSFTVSSATVSANLDKLEYVLVDNERLANTDYTAKTGSIIINLTPTYLSTLNIGNHTITIVCTDGYISRTFTISSTSTGGDDGKTDDYKTGDNFNAVLWICILLASVAVVVVILLVTKKRGKRTN